MKTIYPCISGNKQNIRAHQKEENKIVADA